jgi:hypothetical protein
MSSTVSAQILFSRLLDDVWNLQSTSKQKCYASEIEGKSVNFSKFMGLHLIERVETGEVLFVGCEETKTALALLSWIKKGLAPDCEEALAQFTVLKELIKEEEK